LWLAIQQKWMIFLPPRKVMRGCFGTRRPVGKPRDRWADAVWRDAADLLPILDWKSATRKTGGWRKETGEAKAR